MQQNAGLARTVQLSGGEYRLSDLPHVNEVGATAPAKHVQPGEGHLE